MADHRVVSKEQWLAARQAHLAKEKEFTRLRDELSAERRDLPWTAVDKRYVFHSPVADETLADLFDGRKQLIIYHFMYGPDWEEGCPSCSFWADNFEGVDVHLAHRDISLLAVSNTTLANIEAYKARMGWTFKWVSSLGSDFNRDYGVTFTDAEVADGQMYYNYRMTSFPSSEAPGISVFVKDDGGQVFHTYSCYSRGLDMLNGAYHYIDLTPMGRAEEGERNMYWLRRRDQYDD